MWVKFPQHYQLNLKYIVNNFPVWGNCWVGAYLPNNPTSVKIPTILKNAGEIPAKIPNWGVDLVQYSIKITTPLIL